MAKTIWNAVLGALVLGLVTGCATTAPARAPTDAIQRIKRVAVVSTAGGVFGRVYTGITVFGNERHVKAVPDWGLDTIYEEQIAATLRTGFGMTVVNDAIDPKTFAQIDRKFPDMWPDWVAIEGVARKTCTDHQLDGLFVLAKVGEWGLSVYVDGRPSSKAASVIFSAQLGFLDCTTGRVIAGRWVQNGTVDTTVLYNRERPPSMALPADWPRHGEWRPETYDKARREFIRLPQQAWGDTLNYMLKAPSR